MSKLDKRLFRKRLRAQRNRFMGIERSQAEAKVCDLLQSLLQDHRPKHSTQDAKRYVATYYPFDGEVDLRALWGGGFFSVASQKTTKTISLIGSQQESPTINWVFPVHKKEEPLSFVSPHTWHQGSDLAIAHGEPVALSKIDLMLVPGVAFSDQNGLRLGLGGGHYDRTLALAHEKSWSGLTFGVGFSFQVQSDLPSDPWDHPLDGLVTELGVKMFTQTSKP